MKRMERGQVVKSLGLLPMLFPLTCISALNLLLAQRISNGSSKCLGVLMINDATTYAMCNLSSSVALMKLKEKKSALMPNINCIKILGICHHSECF
jgi:hypothetical protein